MIRMWQAGENQEASRKVLILLSLLKQCCESHDMMLFSESLSSPPPFGLLQEKGSLTPALTKEIWKQNPQGWGMRKGSLLFILNVLMDAGFIIAGLVCFVFVLLIVGFVMITRTQNK